MRRTEIFEGVRILFLLVLLFLIPLFFVGYLAYHLPRQEPRGWRQFAILTILSSSGPAAIAGYRFIEASVPGVLVGLAVGCLSTGVIMVMGKQLYDGMRREQID